MPTLQHRFAAQGLTTGRLQFVLVVLVAVGIAGMIIPITRPLFQAITPLYLLLNFGVCLLYVPGKPRVAAAMLGVGVLGFWLEVAGVATGVIFGAYTYGDVLGPTLWNVPLMLGINWAWLTYLSVQLALRVTRQKLLAAMLSSALLVLMDIFLEPVAIYLGMWTWANELPPTQNYVVWGLAGFLFSFLLLVAIPKHRNPLSWLQYGLLLVFYGAIWMSASWLNT